MRNLTFIFFAIIISLSVSAQEKSNVYKFTVEKENPITSIKNQAHSSTCWAFSSLGFLESELIKAGKGDIDLSEMYTVRKNYEDKAKKNVRLHGSISFSPGGSFADVTESINEYGLMPNSLYEGLNYGSKKHNHEELHKVLAAYIKEVAQSKTLTTAWFDGFQGILDAYLGKVPETFTYKGKTYTPKSFAKMLGLKQSDYVSITSFTHHPFYTKFPIEVPDNWRWANSYNVPMNEMIEIIDNAIMKGYTVAWGSDVSEIGFSRKGFAVVPDENAPENIGSDEDKWLGLSDKQRNEAMRAKLEKEIVKEKVITQQMRQEAFDNFQTTDDHGMQIYGIAKDQNGNKYYMVKNSWGEAGPYKGIWYASVPFVEYKTLNFIVNKKAIPSAIAKKLGL